MLDKLNSIEANYDELTALLSSPSVQSDQNEYRKHAKALSDMQPLVERFREYKLVLKEAAQAEDLAKSGDAARYMVVFKSDPLGARAISAVQTIRRRMPELMSRAGDILGSFQAMVKRFDVLSFVKEEQA